MSRRRKIKQAKRPEHSKRNLLVALGGLSFLAVAAVALTAFALNASNLSTSDTELITPPTPTAEVTPEPEEVDPEPELTPESSASAVSVQRLLVTGASPGHLIRATVGACTDPVGVIEVSVNDGVDWTQAQTADVGSTEILQFDATQTGIVTMVSLGADCLPQSSRSFVGGVDWELDESLGFSWFVEPTDHTVVSTPIGQQPLPCSAAGLASRGDRAIALCDDSTVTVSYDSGASWSNPGAVPNAAAVGMTDEGFVVASTNEGDCVGVQVRNVVGATFGNPGQCFAVEGSSDGNTALDGRAGELFLWTADRFVRSADEGTTWH